VGKIIDGGASRAPADFAAALSCFQRDDFERADLLCGQLLSEQPAHIDGWHLWGLVACERKEFERAIGFLQQSLALSASQPAVLANLGNALVQAQRAAEALDCFDRAQALQPATAATLYGRGCALMQLKRAQEALAALDGAGVRRNASTHTPCRATGGLYGVVGTLFSRSCP
jgi:tetratricopeptide (TPR) repeat protein